MDHCDPNSLAFLLIKNPVLVLKFSPLTYRRFFNTSSQPQRTNAWHVLSFKNSPECVYVWSLRFFPINPSWSHHSNSSWILKIQLQTGLFFLPSHTILHTTFLHICLWLNLVGDHRICRYKRYFYWPTTTLVTVPHKILYGSVLKKKLKPSVEYVH